MRQRGPCVRALCEPAALLLSKNMARTRPRCNATPSEDFVLQKSHLKRHTSPFTLHTSSHLISSHLISSHLTSSCLISSHICNLISSQLISSQLTIAQPFWSHGSSSELISEILCVRKLLLSALPSTILYYKTCTTCFPVLLCTTSEFVWWMGAKVRSATKMNSDEFKQAVGVGHCGACMPDCLTRKDSPE